MGKRKVLVDAEVPKRLEKAEEALKEMETELSLGKSIFSKRDFLKRNFTSIGRLETLSSYEIDEALMSKGNNPPNYNDIFEALAGQGKAAFDTFLELKRGVDESTNLAKLSPAKTEGEKSKRKEGLRKLKTVGLVRAVPPKVNSPKAKPGEYKPVGRGVYMINPEYLQFWPDSLVARREFWEMLDGETAEAIANSILERTK